MSETREERLYNLVRLIGTDYVELSHEKVRSQRDDYMRMCRKLIKELDSEEATDESPMSSSAAAAIFKGPLDNDF